jgi:hypothetical protein
MGCAAARILIDEDGSSSERSMANKLQSKCPGCGDIFTLVVRNRGRQKCCPKRACRAAADRRQLELPVAPTIATFKLILRNAPQRPAGSVRHRGLGRSRAAVGRLSIERRRYRTDGRSYLLQGGDWVPSQGFVGGHTEHKTRSSSWAAHHPYCRSLAPIIRLPGCAVSNFAAAR